jgi:glycosyltransferase involved in cell wall biosynthesis
MKVKKILFLSPLPPPHYGSAMSSEMCLDILKNSDNFEVKNIKLNLAEEMSSIGRINLKKIVKVLSTGRKIKKVMRDFNPDLVYFVPATYGLGLFREAYYVNILKRYFKKKIIFHIRSRITEENWINKAYRVAYRLIFCNQAAIVLDKSLSKDLRGLIPQESISVLPNAIKNKISEKEFKNIIKNRNNKDIKLLFLSNMDKTKGWVEVLQACSLLEKAKIRFTCEFAGAWLSKDDEKFFKRFVKEQGLEKKVKHLGKVNEIEKDVAFRKSDILVYPTKLDTFGRVIIEGMMYGLPVIANGIGAIPTTIQHDKTGFIMKNGIPLEIIKFVKILKNKNLRKRFGKKGRERFLKNYEKKVYANKFMRIISNSLVK